MSYQDGEEMKKVKKPVWIAILVICIAVLIGGAIFLINYFRPPVEDSLSRSDFTYPPTEAATEAPTFGETTATAAPTEPPTQRPTFKKFGQETATEPEDWSNLSFDELTKKNPDIYAWIYIPGTAVDYPVCQSADDEYEDFYLDHNIYRQYQFSGTIYSQKMNSRDFDDRVTVLYGHNMLNGSMFASLHNFENEDFFKDYNTAFVITKDKMLTYLIYSAYTYDDRHILHSFHMEYDDSFRSYLDSTLDPHTYDGRVREGVELDMDSRILTLSTCTNGGGSNTRYLVQGVLVDEQPRE